MMRLFSMYPGGRPGIALLLMRIALSLVLTQPASRDMVLVAPPWMAPLPWLLAAAAILGAGTTGAASAAVVLLIVLSALVERGFDGSHACAILDATALVLLGPGAYSLDARLLGRRRLNVAAEDERRRP